MTDKRTFVITTNLVKGDPIRYKVELAEQEIFNVGSALESAMRGSYVGVELNNKLTLVPVSNIQSIEIDPSPNRLIASVVQGAKPVD
jgi:hypothetical protein